VVLPCSRLPSGLLASIPMASGLFHLTPAGPRLFRGVRLWSKQMEEQARPPICGGGDPLPDEATVRERLIALIDGGVLQRDKPRRIWAGPCREAHPCTACGITIYERETEFDILTPAGVMIFFHPRCMNLWPDEAQDGDGQGSEVRR
jgi:hypothetical protein